MRIPRALTFLLALLPGALAASSPSRAAPEPPGPPEVPPIEAASLAGSGDVRIRGRLREHGEPVAGRLRAWRLGGRGVDGTPALLAALEGEGDSFLDVTLEAGEVYDVAYDMGGSVLLEARGASRARVRVLLQAWYPCRSLIDLEIRHETREIPVEVDDIDLAGGSLRLLSCGWRADLKTPALGVLGEPLAVRENRFTMRTTASSAPWMCFLSLPAEGRPLGVLYADRQGEGFRLALQDVERSFSFSVADSNGKPLPEEVRAVPGSGFLLVRVEDHEGEPVAEGNVLVEGECDGDG